MCNISRYGRETRWLVQVMSRYRSRTRWLKATVVSKLLCWKYAQPNLSTRNLKQEVRWSYVRFKMHCARPQFKKRLSVNPCKSIMSSCHHRSIPTKKSGVNHRCKRGHWQRVGSPSGQTGCKPGTLRATNLGSWYCQVLCYVDQRCTWIYWMCI